MSNNPGILLICHNRIAMPALRSLHQEGLLAAIAVPDLHDFIQQPFRETARQLDVPFISLNKNTYWKELDSLLTTLQPAAVFVISFPWRIPVSSLPRPPYGFLNFHGGLLPQMRGSDPMFDCIRKGRTATGLTVHQMDDSMDTGPVVMQEEITIDSATTHGMLTSQMAWAAARLCGTLAHQISRNTPLTLTAQNEEEAVYFPRPVQTDTCINWETMAASEIQALVNACNPQLKGATAIFRGWKFGVTHVTEITLTGDDGKIKPGTILYADPQQGLIIYCRNGTALRLDITYTEEGYFPGYKLSFYGLQPGMCLNELTEIPDVMPASTIQ